MQYDKRLKLLRENKKLSQTKLGKLLELSQSTVSNYERNARNPSLKEIDKLTKFFNVSADYLLGLTDNPTPLKTNKKIRVVLLRRKKNR